MTKETSRRERIARLLGGATPHADAAALVDTLVLMLAADGEVKAGELEETIAIAQRFPAFKGTPEADVKQMVVGSIERILREGRKGRLDALAEKLLGIAAREDAFRLAAALRFADGEVAEEEDQLLLALRTALHIEAERADILIEDVERRLFKA